MRLRTLLRFGVAGAVAVLLALPTGASGRTEISQIICSDPGTYGSDPAPSGGSTTDVQPAPTAYRLTAYLPPGYGECGSYDWGVDPAYTGEYYTDEASAAASEPPPPAPVTPALPTWRNLYDWPAGHGYVGWRAASVAQTGQYGQQGGLGGQYGLWLWPAGGSAYSYSQGQYAEWFFPAPGTTRLASATIQFTYRNKLLSHHCIDVGFRSGSTIIAHNEHCKPVKPPDSQRGVTLTIVDPSANPTSKELYVRIRVDCGGASTCSKHIPQHDPLVNGAFVRVTNVDMTLVDDDLPVVTPSGPFWNLGDNYSNGRIVYPLRIDASDAGSGIVRNWLERLGSGTLSSGDAPCDPTHNTPALDNRICPPSYALDTLVDSNPFPEGTNRFVAKSSDVAANVGASDIWIVYIDRTPPPSPTDLSLKGFDADLGIATVQWSKTTDPPLPDGVPGSGLQQYQARYAVNGGAFTGWFEPDEDGIDVGGLAVGDTLSVEVRALDRVGNTSAASAATFTMPSVSTPSGPVLTGKVVNGNGAGVSSASVSIAIARDGATSTIGNATTSDDGSFSIPITPGSAREVADEALANAGWVNFDVVATDGSLSFDGGVPRKISVGTWSDGNGSPDPMTIVLSDGAAGVSSVSAPARRLAGGGAPIYCSTDRDAIAQYDKRRVIIGELHTGLDQRAHFDYGQKADTDIDVAISVDGTVWKKAGFKAHVGTSMGTTDEATEKQNVGQEFGHKLASYFRVVKYKVHRSCFFGYGNKTWYELRATRWQGGLDIDEDVSRFDHQCLTTYSKYALPQPPDSEFGTITTRAFEYSAGLEIFGISLGTRSGYSRWVDLHWHFGKKFNRYWLCGDTDFPRFAKRIFAGG
jgi:hypothetical protein